MSLRFLQTSLLFSALSLLPFLAAAEEPAPRMMPDPSTATAVTSKIDILDLIKKGEFETNINPKADPDITETADKIFALQEDGTLKISGKGYGYLATKKAYKDFHLVLEYMWTGPTWGKRADRARDNGLLIHSHGPHGAYGGSWCAAVEAQIIEGGTGDILVLSPKGPDGTVIETKIEAEYIRDKNKQMKWKKGAERQEVTKGRINWEKRDEDWTDTLGFHGKEGDVQKPVGEWNVLEVIAKGDTLQYILNGHVVNEAFAVSPSAGCIGIQTEGAEMAVRRYELLPLE